VLTPRLGLFRSARSWLPTRVESVCNEYDDNGQQHWIGKASDTGKTALKAAPEILAKYVGVCKGQYLRALRTVEVTFSGGTLFVSLNGGPGGIRLKLLADLQRALGEAKTFDEALHAVLDAVRTAGFARPSPAPPEVRRLVVPNPATSSNTWTNGFPARVRLPTSRI
jgi:hypothetical protein